MNNQKAKFRRLASGTPTNTAKTWTQHLGPGITVVWAERPDRTRQAEEQVEEERKFFRDFGPRPSRRHPGLQCR